MTGNQTVVARPPRDPLETLSCAARHLERFGWSHYALSEGEGTPALLTAWGRGGSSFEMAIHCESNPDEIIVVVSHILAAPPDLVSADGLSALRGLLEERNSQLRRGAWIYDGRRREVHFRASLLLGDELDYEGLRALLITAIGATETMSREGQALLATHPARPRAGSRSSGAAMLSEARLALLLGDRSEAERLLSQISPESLPTGSAWGGGRSGAPD